MTTVILLVFGAIIGSFLNVVGLRWNSGLALSGRSQCSHCGKKLSWFELIPILSFLLLLGRCRSCHTKISWQYPIVELWTGLIFLSIYNLQFTILQKLILILVFCIYIVIMIYDFRHKIIPDTLVYSAIFLSLLVPLFIVHYSLIDWLAGPALFAFFGLVWLLSKGRAMGFGDAKLALSVGLLLGAAGGLSAIVVAFWLGAFYGLLLVVFNSTYPLSGGAKKITMKSEVPFAPFIVLGAWIAVMLNLDLFHVSSF